MGNIHQSAINHDRLMPNGSSFKATLEKDFLTTTDGWFRPVSEQVGPDGALWIMDWYDKYPCYQNAQADPEGVDREHGRIWRVVYTGGKPDVGVPPRPAGMNLAKSSSAELVDLLAHPNIWQRRMARRLLSERRDASAKPLLVKLLASRKSVEARLGALWSLHGAELLDDAILDKYVNDKEAAIRAWVARLTGERQDASKKALARLAALAKDDDPTVRTAAATATRQFVSGSLTVDTPPSSSALNGQNRALSSPSPLNGERAGVRGETVRLADNNSLDVYPILRELLQHPAASNDLLYAHIVWMALEPKLAIDPQATFAILTEKKTVASEVSRSVLRRAMRRIFDTKDANKFNAAVAFLSTLEDKNPLLVPA